MFSAVLVSTAASGAVNYASGQLLIENDGTWSLVGTNPGVIFFGFGSSPALEPTTPALLAIGVVLMAGLLRRARPSPAQASRPAPR